MVEQFIQTLLYSLYYPYFPRFVELYHANIEAGNFPQLLFVTLVAVVFATHKLIDLISWGLSSKDDKTLSVLEQIFAHLTYTRVGQVSYSVLGYLLLAYLVLTVVLWDFVIVTFFATVFMLSVNLVLIVYRGMMHYLIYGNLVVSFRNKEVGIELHKDVELSRELGEELTEIKLTEGNNKQVYEKFFQVLAPYWGWDTTKIR